MLSSRFKRTPFSKEASSIDLTPWSHADQTESLLSPSHKSEDGVIPGRSALMSTHQAVVSCLLLFAKLLLLGFSLYGVYMAAVQPLYERLIRPTPIICNCGNSTAEALRRGCKFDSLATSWLPLACRDDALTEEFDHSGPGPDGEWIYYLHQNLSEPLRLHQVAMLADAPDMEARKFWMTSEWHTAHCLFYWRKSLRSTNRIKSGGRSPGADKIEETFSDAIHVDHCAMKFLNRRHPDSLSVMGFAGFGDPLEGFDAAEFLAKQKKPASAHRKQSHNAAVGENPR